MQEERNAQELLDDEDKPEFTPQAFDSLRQVPMYASFIKERFERCLDLYLCPRSKKKRINVDPQSLVPKLPKPQDLQPFPTTLLLRYTGHTSKVRTVHFVVIIIVPSLLFPLKSACLNGLRGAMHR